MSGLAWRLRILAEAPSTNDLLAQLAVAGAPEGTALVARVQTAGRGRAGRGWDSAEGNLHLSVLLRPSLPLRFVPLFGLAAGVALAEVSAAALPPAAGVAALSSVAAFFFLPPTTRFPTFTRPSGLFVPCANFSCEESLVIRSARVSTFRCWERAPDLVLRLRWMVMAWLVSRGRLDQPDFAAYFRG